MTRRSQIAIAVAAIIGVQLAAVTIYLAVQRGRNSRQPVAFLFERLTTVEQAPVVETTRADYSAARIEWPAASTRLVHFWATWCEPCVKELPSLLAFADLAEKWGIVVVAIAVDDNWSDIISFFNGAVPAEVWLESKGTGHAKFGVSTLPDSYLVDATGRVLERYAGTRDWSSPEARDHLRTAAK